MNKLFSGKTSSRNQSITHPLLKAKGIHLVIKREDELHPIVSGNKFRKLKYNVLEALKQQKKVLLTFGGAYSNHIAAAATAGKYYGIPTVGVIRGEELAAKMPELLQRNPTLAQAVSEGMHLKFVSREAYRSKTTPEFLAALQEEFGNYYLVPEGGTNTLAVKGCEEILIEEDKKFHYICAAVGTGGTLSGIINAAEATQHILGFPALKGDFLQAELKQFVTDNTKQYRLISEYHFGGYAKWNDALISFINAFKLATSIPLEPIYTGKMLFGLFDMIAKDQFKPGTRILVVHTGGLQGIAGINQQLKKKNKNLIV